MEDRQGAVCPFGAERPRRRGFVLGRLAGSVLPRHIRGGALGLEDGLNRKSIDVTAVAPPLAKQTEDADIGGYYRLDQAKVTAVMRPSVTFNAALAALL